MSVKVFNIGARVVKSAEKFRGGMEVGTHGEVIRVDGEGSFAEYTVHWDDASESSDETCYDYELDAEPVDLPVEREPRKSLYYGDTHIEIMEGDRVYRTQKSVNRERGTSKQHGQIIEVFDGEAHGMVGIKWGQRQDIECLRSTGLVFESRDLVQNVGNFEQVPTLPPAPPSAPASFSALDPVTKDTNPKDALAGFKPRWFSFLPLQVLIGVGKAMFEGGWKYGKHNYRQSGVRASVYVDAAVCGHLMPWMEGEDCDENGMNHIEKAIASLMVLRDSQINGNWIDDRPLKAKNFASHMASETDHFQKMKAALKEKFGDPVAPYTEIGRDQPR